MKVDQIMKIIHTSDWHLGHLLYEHDRTEEQKHFLDELADIVAREQPDAMVVCGDVFDRIVPDTTAQEMYADGLLAIRKACPQMAIVVTAGNHDSKSLLDANGRLWELAGVRVIGQVERRDDGKIDVDRHIIEIKDKGFIVAAPHIYEKGYPKLGDEDADAAKRKEDFFRMLLEETSRRNTARLPVVLTAHLAIDRCDTRGHDFIGGVETTALNVFGSSYDYLALGHIHRRQTMSSVAPVAHYCGAPIAISFDEDCDHGVDIVEINAGQIPEIRQIPIENIYPLINIPEEPVAFESALKELGELGENVDGYVRVNILDDGTCPADANEKARMVLVGKRAKYCCVNRVKPVRETKETDSETGYDIESFDKVDPRDVAMQYYKNAHGVDMPEEMAALLDEVIEAVANGE